MACNPEVLKHVPLFALLDEEETAVLAAQVRLKRFAPRQRIYKIGDSSGQAYVVVSGRVRVRPSTRSSRKWWSTNPRTESSSASRRCWNRLRIRPRRSRSTRRCVWKWISKTSPCCCSASRWPGWTCCAVLGRQFHASQQLVRLRANRHPNEVIEKDATFGERIADMVAGFGGSWTFIISFGFALAVYMSDRCRAGEEGVGSLSLYSAESVSYRCWRRCRRPSS